MPRGFLFKLPPVYQTSHCAVMVLTAASVVLTTPATGTKRGWFYLFRTEDNAF
jgi:hypothetical protein